MPFPSPADDERYSWGNVLGCFVLLVCVILIDLAALWAIADIVRWLVHLFCN